MDSRVGFNLGGKIFSTTKHTLQFIKDSFLHTLVFGNIPSLKDKDGNYVIDRNPSLFETILDVYRIGYVILPNDSIEKMKLMEELRFYQLDQFARGAKLIRLVDRMETTRTHTSIYVIGKDVVKLVSDTTSLLQKAYVRKVHSWSLITDLQLILEAKDEDDVLETEKLAVRMLSWLLLDVDELEELETE